MSKKVTTCIACDGKSFSKYCKGLVRCNTCTLVVAEDIPSNKEITELYQKEYFFGMEYSNYEADRPALEHNFKQRIQSMRGMLTSTSSVVEIGCAYGYFLNLIKDMTKEHIGFDVTEEGIEFAIKELSVNATTEDFMKYKIKSGSIDSVFMWDVVEHLSHPDEYLEKISLILKPGGKVAMTTGNVDSLLSKVRKGKWRMIHPPTHVYYFSPETLSLLLEKYGLKTISVRHRGVSRNVGSVFNQLIANQRAAGKGQGVFSVGYSIAKSVGVDNWSVPLNTFDIMEVIAEKQ